MKNKTEKHFKVGDRNEKMIKRLLTIWYKYWLKRENEKMQYSYWAMPRRRKP